MGRPQQIVDALAARPRLLYETFREINRRFNHGELDYLGPWEDDSRLDLFANRCVARVYGSGGGYHWEAKAPNDFGKLVEGVEDSPDLAMAAADAFLEQSGWKLL